MRPQRVPTHCAAGTTARSNTSPPAWPPSGGQAGEPHPSSSAIDGAENRHVKSRNQHYRHLNACPHRRSQPASELTLSASNRSLESSGCGDNLQAAAHASVLAQQHRRFGAPDAARRWLDHANCRAVRSRRAHPFAGGEVGDRARAPCKSGCHALIVLDADEHSTELAVVSCQFQFESQRQDPDSSERG